jgi:hypothetical protein
MPAPGADLFGYVDVRPECVELSAKHLTVGDPIHSFRVASGFHLQSGVRVDWQRKLTC